MVCRSCLPIVFFGQVIRLDDRLVEGVGRACAHVAFALRSMLPAGDGEAGVVVKQTVHAELVAGRREDELQIVTACNLVGMPESVNHRRAQIEDALRAGKVLDDFTDEPHATREFVDCLDVLHAHAEARREVIAQIFTDPCEIVRYVDAERAQQLAGADARDL